MCLLPLSVLWVSKTTRDSYKAFFSFFFLKLLQFQLAVLVDLTYWTCFDTILTLELLLSTFVTMGTRLERTQVTLCGSNTELIHRVLPSWEFHMAPTSSHQGHDIFFFFQPCCCSTTTHLCQHMYTYAHSRTHRTPQAFSSFTAGCLLVRGLALARSSRLFKVEPCNYKSITPRLMQLLLSFCPGSFSHQASFICGLEPIVSCGRWEA